MNEIKIFLKTSGSVAELYKTFNLYAGSYRNAQITVYVPKAILLLTTGTGNAVKTGALLTAPNGAQSTTASYFADYVDDETVNGVEYSVYTQTLPNTFTLFAGTQTVVVNVVNMTEGEDGSEVATVTTSQTAQLVVLPSAYLESEAPMDPSDAERLDGRKMRGGKKQSGK